MKRRNRKRKNRKRRKRGSVPSEEEKERCTVLKYLVRRVEVCPTAMQHCQRRCSNRPFAALLDRYILTLAHHCGKQQDVRHVPLLHWSDWSALPAPLLPTGPPH